ncbi:exodeoxyribonuclease VII small subunit [Zoogloea sp. LCSB751]|uniref:exodeoxyribonuclease VII small subunit n=1 Tax=Zoogloea sp. LCSB751 TaxID=1965277 RepID=UPI0009A4ED3F|nr:exodeoxyribonuclease VII small subunit [Zoogloea sp. LCSB751]
MVKSASTKTSNSFESSISELESIVQEMENGSLSLEQSLSAYERGTALLRHCQDVLNKAEQSIRIVENSAANPEQPQP